MQSRECFECGAELEFEEGEWVPKRVLCMGCRRISELERKVLREERELENEF